LTISKIENNTPDENVIIEIDQFIENISHSIITALSDDENLKFKTVFDLKSNQKAKNFNATMIGLILNELITNTTKYAFEDRSEKNKLVISSRMEGDNLIIIIKDNGQGYDAGEIMNNSSLGIELVGEMVAQLNGSITVNSLNGTENIIILPI
ncbi:MAG TPA: ATP-binding protein, partial [Christiangramia sp.]|nr:ATP-binding protein [Christiangramia sp.]